MVQIRPRILFPRVFAGHSADHGSAQNPSRVGRWHDDPMLAARRRLREKVSASLATRSDGELAALVDTAGIASTGVGGGSAVCDVDEVPVFVKRIPLTNRELTQPHSTANLFDLPTFCQYGIGSPGFNAWRELAGNLIVTDGVLAGDTESFPLLYHWRILPGRAPLAAEYADIDTAETALGGCEAVRARLNALAIASSSLVLFCEHIPHPLADWLHDDPAGKGPIPWSGSWPGSWRCPSICSNSRPRRRVVIVPSPLTPAPAPVASRHMDRIAIIGCGGSGKTHLANQLAALLNLPLTHLDAVYYDADWNPLSAAEFAALQEKLVAEPRWLIEGNYASSLPIRLARADTVIFLDLPAVACLTGILQRRWRYRGGQHAKDGVYDRITWKFVRYIWGYRRTMRPRVRGLLDEHRGDATLVTLTSRRQTTRYMAQLRSETSTLT